MNMAESNRGHCARKKERLFFKMMNTNLEGTVGALQKCFELTWNYLGGRGWQSSYHLFIVWFLNLPKEQKLEGEEIFL